MAAFRTSGDQLASGDNQGTNPVSWHGVVLAAVVRGDDVVVRAYGGKSGAVDVSKPVPSGDLVDSLDVAGGGASVVFRVESLAGRAPEAGALVAYDYARIQWDDAKGAPVVHDVWSCDESEKECAIPSWANQDGAGSAAPASAPSAQEAAAAVKSWLRAIAGGHADQATRSMTDTFEILLAESSAASCPEVDQLQTWSGADRGRAAQCLANLFGTGVSSLGKKAVAKNVSATWPEDYEANAITTVAPAGTAAFVTVSSSDGDVVVAVVVHTESGARIAGAFVSPAVGG